MSDRTPIRDANNNLYWHDGIYSFVQYYATGNKYWYIDNNLHREDGPAVELGDGTKYWFLNGKYIICNSQEQFLQLIRLKAFW